MMKRADDFGWRRVCMRSPQDGPAAPLVRSGHPFAPQNQFRCVFNAAVGTYSHSPSEIPVTNSQTVVVSPRTRTPSGGRQTARESRFELDGVLVREIIEFAKFIECVSELK